MCLRTGRIVRAGCMSERQLQLDLAREGVSRPIDLVMRYPPNWTAVIFFACMSFLHLINGLGAFWKGRIEGEMSAVLGVAFAIATAVALRLKNELAVRPSAGDLQLRTSLGRVWFDRTARSIWPAAGASRHPRYRSFIFSDSAACFREVGDSAVTI